MTVLTLALQSKRIVKLFSRLYLTSIITVLASLIVASGVSGSATANTTAWTDQRSSDSTAVDSTASPISPTSQQEGTEPIRFERINTADGLSFPFVRSIIQDQYGFMWFGTDQGLNKYDGYQFSVYRSDQSDPTSPHSSYITDLLVDRDGTLWVAGSAGVDIFNRKTETFTHIDPRGGEANVLYEDTQGLIWAAFWHGLYAYDRASLQVVYDLKAYSATLEGTEVLSDNSANALCEDEQGELWIGTDQGLDRFDRETGSFQHYEHDPNDPASLSSHNISVMLVDREGILWVGTFDGGLNRFDPSSGTFVHYRNSPNDPQSLSNDFVTSLLEDSHGVLWVGTVNGLEQFDPVQDRFIHHRYDPTDPYSLSDNAVVSLYEDRSGVLWVGTTNGLSKFNRRGDIFSLYQRRPDLVPTSPRPLSKDVLFGISVDKVTATFEDQDGTLWIGTYFGGLNRVDLKTGQLEVYMHDPADPGSLMSDIVTAIFEDASGILWVGTESGWLEQFDSQTDSFIHFRQLPRNISVITQDLSGNLWVGTFNGLYRMDPQNGDMVHYPYYWQEYDHWKRYGSLSHNIILDIYIDQYGAPWVGTFSGGINLWDREQDNFTHLRYDGSDLNSLSHDQVLSILEDPRDKHILWIGTGGGGLNRFDRATDTFTHYTTEDGLIDNVVGCILFDDDGYLWLATPKGLSRFNSNTEIFSNYDLTDGVGALNVGGLFHEPCHRSKTGEMYFGSLHGIYVFHPSQVVQNTSPPSVMITALNIFNKPLRSELLPDEHIALSYQENYLSFEFAALDHTLPEKNQYAYRMEGIDKEWVYAGDRRYVDYAGLQPGNYIFRVKGSNNDGIWNEAGVAAYITIEAPIWNTWSFRGLVGMGLILGAVGIFRQRIRSIQARSQELETQVVERTQEIETRRKELEILYKADQELYRHLDFDRLLQVLVETAVQTLKADKGSLMVWDEDREALLVHAVYGFQPREIPELTLAPRMDLAVHVATSGEPLVVDNATTDPRLSDFASDTKHILSFMLVPIQVGDEIFGVFSVDFTRLHTFDEDERRLMLSLAQRAGLAIQNAHLFSQVQQLAAVEERQRLARDLHDAVSQMLFSASLIADALPSVWEVDPVQAHILLEKLQRSNRGALAEMRALLMELRPGALAEASLPELLHQLAQAASGREGIPVAVDADEPCELTGDVKISLYRIAQEAMNNVVKHAQASQAAVSLHCIDSSSQDKDEHRVEMSINDDGVGFDPQRVSQECLGLNIMRERADAIGAILEIKSEPGRGTSLRVIWGKDPIGDGGG